MDNDVEKVIVIVESEKRVLHSAQKHFENGIFGV